MDTRTSAEQVETFLTHVRQGIGEEAARDVTGIAPHLIALPLHVVVALLIHRIAEVGEDDCAGVNALQDALAPVVVATARKVAAHADYHDALDTPTDKLH